MVEAILFGGTGLLSLLVVWIFEDMFKREAPFGLAAEYIMGLIGGVGWAALDYYILIPALIGNVTGLFKLLASMGEGIFFAWAILWIVRQIVRPPFKSTEDNA